jgi:hypothetical protein
MSYTYSDYASEMADQDRHHEEIAPFYESAERVTATLDSLPDTRVVRRRISDARRAEANLYAEDGDESGSWIDVAWGDWTVFREAEQALANLLSALFTTCDSRRERRSDRLRSRGAAGLDSHGRKTFTMTMGVPMVSVTTSPCLMNAPPRRFAALSSVGELTMAA